MPRPDDTVQQLSRAAGSDKHSLPQGFPGVSPETVGELSTLYRPDKYHSAVASLRLLLHAYQWQIHMGEGAIATPRTRDRKIFYNVGENKLSDRKLSPIPFMSAACYVE